MPRSIHGFVALMLMLLASLAQAGVEATVDRTELAVGETLQLTIQASGVKLFSKQPDLTPLEADFDVLSKSQSSSTRLINGDFTSSTSWIFQLAPKRPGKTSIPPITVGRDRTDTIEIQVNLASHAPAATADDEVRLEAELADTTVYVGAQALLTLRVSRAPSARFQVEEPEHPDASIRQVNERSFQQIQGGMRILVTEYTFALFPRVEGEMVLKPLTLVAEIMTQSPRSMFDPLFGKSRRVIRRTEPLTLNVIPPPAEVTPSDWLPAQKLSISQSWSKDPQALAVGDSITRTIEIEARGVTAAQLPPLLMGEIDGLKFYPDQPTVTDDTSARGVTGRRTEKMAMVVTRPGRYQLPALRMVWWDVTANAPRVAELPAMSFEVAPAATAAAPTPNAADATVAAAATGPAVAARPWYGYPLWWLVSVLLSALCATLGVLYYRARSRQQQPDRSQSAPPADEAAAFKRLQSACAGRDPAQVYRTLVRWWQCFFDTAELPGPADMAASGANQALMTQALALQRQLFGAAAADPGAWDAKALLDAVTRQRESDGRDSPAAALPALYPARAH